MARTTINSLGVPAGTITAADLTFPLTDFSSTGIDDNATSTAIIIDSSNNANIVGDLFVDTNTLVVDATNNRVGIGEVSPATTLDIKSSSGLIRNRSTSGSAIIRNESSAGNYTLFETDSNGQLDIKRNTTTYFTIDSSGNIAVTGTVDGRDLATDGTKLDGIESGATADQTASEILTAIKTVDGAGSGLDADTLDGNQASAFATLTGATFTGDIIANGLEVGTAYGSDTQYLGIKRSAASSNDFILIQGSSSDAGSTYLSAGSGKNVHIRASANSTTNQLVVTTSGTTIGGNTVWHAGNDGSGSGLDADTLDGINGSSYLRSDTSDTFTGNLTIASGSLTLPAGYNLQWGSGYNSGNSTIWSDGTASIIRMAPTGNSSGKTLELQATKTFSYKSFHVGSEIGSRSASLSVESTGNSGPIAAKTSGYSTVWSILPWSGGQTYISSGIYYDDGTWVHASDNSDNCLFSISGSGAKWYASNNSTGSWNVASNVSLWNGSGYWDRALSTNVTYNGNTIWHAGNDGSGSGLDADTVDGIQGSNLLTLSGSQTVTGVKTFSSAGGNVFLLNDTNATNATNANIYFYFQAQGSNLGYFGYGTTSNNYLYISNPSAPIYLAGSSVLLRGGYEAWGTDNDGSGSGLDADTVDGIQGASFLRSDTTDTTSGDLRADGDFQSKSQIRAQGWWNTATGSYGDTAVEIGMSAGTGYILCYNRNTATYDDLVIQPASLNLAPASNGAVNIKGYTAWHAGNDGSGSGLDADLLGGYASSTWLGKKGNSYYQSDNWIQLNTTAGLYAPSYNGAHWLPNTLSSYATWRSIGSRGGYDGILFDGGADTAVMYDSGGNGGVYQQYGDGWLMYYNVTNNCTGFSTSTTSSSYAIYSNGAIYSTGNITAYSDRRVKENVVLIDSALDKVNKLEGVYYNRIDDEKKTKEIGFIAQDVQEVVPELVTYAEDIDEYGVKYGNATALLVEAVKELTKQVNILKKELEEIKNV